MVHCKRAGLLMRSSLAWLDEPTARLERPALLLATGGAWFAAGKSIVWIFQERLDGGLYTLWSHPAQWMVAALALFAVAFGSLTSFFTVAATLLPKDHPIQTLFILIAGGLGTLGLLFVALLVIWAGLAVGVAIALGIGWMLGI